MHKNYQTQMQKLLLHICNDKMHFPKTEVAKTKITMLRCSKKPSVMLLYKGRESANRNMALPLQIDFFLQKEHAESHGYPHF